MSKIKVLFVCTGNIFRSMSAEYCLRDYLKREGIKNIEVSSAGTVAKKYKINSANFNFLVSKGINPQKHKQRRLTKKIVQENDLVIAMADYHQTFIKKKFGIDAPLFNEFAVGKKTTVFDVEDVIKDANNHKNEAKVDKYMVKIAKYIYTNMPQFEKSVQNSFFLFEDFAKGRKKHANGFPFVPLYETKHSLAFLSIDIPLYEDGHVLVIPKKRYTHLDDVPKFIQNDLIKTVSLVGKALKLSHGGYNVLVNNGVSAGQFIFHTHFHVIPRNFNDNIKIEVWKSKNLTKKEFILLNSKVKKAIGRVV
jgi:protein-tyrosine phosphatase